MNSRSLARAIPLFGSALAMLVASCAQTPPGKDSAMGMNVASGAPTGYLTQAAIPDSLILLPPPPAAGSASLAHDEEVHKNAASLRDTPRYRLAAQDAELTFPRAADAFSCSLQAPIDEQHTPHLYRLLQRTMFDAGKASAGAKNKYMRTRPFVTYGEPSCAPKDEAILRGNGSYPSGHATIGTAWGLILAEVDPPNANAILARARSYAESRLVCNVHWQSDILQGRFMGAAVVTQLHAVPEFRKDVEAAAKEIVDLRAKRLAPSRDCAAEAEALKQVIPDVL